MDELHAEKTSDTTFNIVAITIHFLQRYPSRLSTQAVTSLSLTPERKRLPSCQSPVPAFWASSLPLLPSPELEDVAKGITVFPVKSFASINLSTGQAAIPHQNRVADKNRVVFVPIFYGAFYKSNITLIGVIVFTHNTAVIVRPVKVSVAVRLGRL